MKFLQEVAKAIINKGDKLDKFCIICPNARTIDYLKYYVSQEIKRSIWSPIFLNLSELFHKYTSLQKPDDLVLLVELYKSFQKIFGKGKYLKGYSFERFYELGKIILKDFNEIDNYLIDVNNIFVNIKDYQSLNYIEEYLNEEQIRAINDFFGHFSTDNISEEKEYFIELWSNIPSLYADYNKNLLAKGIGYNGLINKNICQKVQSGTVQFNDYEKYIFVGFNALTKSQKIFLQEIQNQHKSEFYWDYDNFYVKDTENEAGIFIRENLKLFSDDLTISRDNLLREKNIELIGFPLEISQTKALSTILEKMDIDFSDTNQLSQTAIVLPDDMLLFPVLHSLPENIFRVNVTIGFPFKNTAVYSFIFQWLDLLHKFIRNKKVSYNDLISFFDNKIIIDFFKIDKKNIRSILENTKKVYFEIKDLRIINNKYVEILFSDKNLTDVEILLEHILELIERIFFIIKKETSEIETEAIYQFYKHLLQIQSLFTNELAKDKDIISSRILIDFLKKYLSAIHIPFQGKNIEELQIMTIMETRNLDFDNLIVLNVNEQVLPKKNTHNSLISEFMRKSFGLPIMLYQDAIYAFLLYSAIQNSKNVFITYSNIISDKSGELSRFVQQLQSETELINSHYQYSEQISPKRASCIEIKKDDAIYNKLKDYLHSNRILSASSLNTYIHCPLKFYFQKILKIPIPEDNSNKFDIDPIKFGNIFHNSMYKLYKNYIGCEVLKSDIVKISKNIDTIVSAEISSELNLSDNISQNGLNSIIQKVIKKYITKILSIDEKYAPFFIISLENSHTYKGNFDISVDNENYSIKILGLYDRVDEKDKKIRIIDYKTGSDDLKITNLEQIFDHEKASNKKKAIFQMLLYSIIFKQNNPNSFFTPMLLKITELKDLHSGKIKVNKEYFNSDCFDTLNEYEELLIELLETIFDKNVNFTQTPNIDNCKYCDYIGICGK